MFFGSSPIETIPPETQTPVPTLTLTLNVTELVFVYQNQIKNMSTKIDCTPPRLKSGFKEFESQFLKQYSLNCTGIGAPVFTVPEYPASPIVNDSVVGKFYWWSNLGYCEFRDDGIWILYAWDNQPHYNTGKWMRGANTSYASGIVYSYNIYIIRPSAMGSTNYTESVTLWYDPHVDRLHLAYYDGIYYFGDFDAWIGRLQR